MGLPKGRTNNPSGKPVGAKGTKTKAWEALGDFFTDAGAERAKKIMLKANDKDFMVHYQNLIELFKPKLARTETELSGSIQMNAPIINVKPKSA